ncbi:2-oxoisovalerate dehydrogenase subunit beta [Venturia nashicola]|uniref:2-oxoisovalerate dehydrogenase subunit beta n=1 Tax=Venturia nashicola TaxID=86259 RepID=A0A4Z1P2T9_9PEZI|nr:2-oxoisovalerate dehydrogenase subunit beta [Venturia nashicola]
MNTNPSFFPLGGCSYSKFQDFSWKDISCNLKQWDVSIQWNPAAYCIIAALHALAVWLALELIVRAIFLFKRRSILYFWSLISVAVGVICITIAFELRIFVIPVDYWAFSVLYTLAQILIKTGFALVLYSRLNILRPKRRLLQAAVAMIIVTAVIGHVPFLIRTIATLVGHLDLVERVHDIAEYFELLFAVQEILISSCYVYYFWQYMNDAPPATQEDMRKDINVTFTGLIAAYIWVLLSDITLYALLYNDYYLARMMIMPLSQAIKLSLEFVVLNYLVNFRKQKQRYLGRLNMVSSVVVPGTRSTSLGGRSTEDESDDMILWLENSSKTPR